MGYGFLIEVWGQNALFTRPELKTERYSYDVMTPSAARGILEAIFWKPGMRYVIDNIYVLNPIKFTSIRRNEVSEKLSARSAQAAINNGRPFSLNPSDHIQQRAATVLSDVRYVIEAHFVMTDKAGHGDTPEKYYNMILRRARNGQFYHAPYFGTREFPAHFSLREQGEIATAYSNEERDLGLMLFDMEYTEDEIRPMFFRAVLKNGVLNVSGCEVMK